MEAKDMFHGQAGQTKHTRDTSRCPSIFRLDAPHRITSNINEYQRTHDLPKDHFRAA